MKKVTLLLLFIVFYSCDVLNIDGDRDICQCEIEITFYDLDFDGEIGNATTNLNSGQEPCRQWFNSFDTVNFTATWNGVTETFSESVSISPDWNINNTRCRGGIIDEI